MLERVPRTEAADADAAGQDGAGPREGAGRFSVVRLPRAWFIVCRSVELRGKPLSRTLQGSPLVIFRDGDGHPRALFDRCPHRNTPLSLGRRTEAGLLECGYHGWQFDGGGVCRAVPGLCGEPNIRARQATSFAAREADGFVWVYATPDTTPDGEPFRFPHVGERGYHFVRRSFVLPSTMHAAIENALDVPHTAFLHRGLFRGTREPREIEVVIRRSGDRAEAEYLGEQRPSGLAGAILAPGGGVPQHFDRFILPSIAQVEYRLSERSHLVLTAGYTPITDFETAVHAMAAVRLPLPFWLVRLVAEPIARRITAQDVAMLRAQSESTRRAGGERFTSTELDVLGASIWKLLRQASTGGPAEAGVHEHRIRMRV